MKPSFQRLGSLQREVLELLWQRGEATVADIHAELCTRRQLTYTTALVALQKLERKGWLAHRSAGRAYVYFPARSRETAETSLLSEILDSTFSGDPIRLVAQLLDGRHWTEPEVVALKKLVDSCRRSQTLGDEP